MTSDEQEPLVERQLQRNSRGSIYGGFCTPEKQDTENAANGHVDDKHEHEEESSTVTTLELFSDLVIVVSIHLVAEPLEEAGDTATLSWYFIQVFMMWLVWQGDMIFMNAATVFRRATCPLHYIVVFTWMALVLNMTQAFAQGNHVAAIYIFLAVRAIEIFCYVKQVAENVPDFIPYERVNNMRSFVPIFTFTYAVCEVIPCVLAIYYGHGEEAWFQPLIFMVVSVFLGYFVGAIKSDNRTHGKIMENAYETDHLHERYELVTLIFIGEICFAAGSPEGMESFSKFTITTFAIMLGFGAYLLIFTSRHASHSTEFWGRSAKHMTLGMTLFAMLFAAIPMLGSGFVRILSPEEEEEEHGSTHEEEEDELTCNVASAHLLCFSTCAFLVILHSSISWIGNRPRRRFTA